MSEHSGQTDQVHEEKLTSSIERVVWNRSVATPGYEAGLDVITRHVGNRADLEIILSDHSGKKYGKFKEKISGNCFWATIHVPDKARDALYAEVKLPKHGLKLKSPPLRLTPPIEITNLKWSQKEARRDDVLKLTADIKGVVDSTEVEISIWEHDSDSAHDLITRLPSQVKSGTIEVEWEYEYHEDTDEIPTKEETKKGYNPPEYFFRVTVHGVSADSGLLTFKDWLELELLEYDGKAIADAKYEITTADGATVKGTLDSTGKAKLSDLPPGPVKIVYPELKDLD